MVDTKNLQTYPAIINLEYFNDHPKESHYFVT